MSSRAAEPSESMPPDVEKVVKLALQLGYGRGGPRGCSVPYEELCRLSQTLTEERLRDLVERQRQADQAHRSRVDQQPAVEDQEPSTRR